jgi:hypothetical protein
MKLHHHAMISLGYGGGVALFAGHGFADPRVYLAALIGGEIIDFVDHPLFHLVYRRSDPHVVRARRLFAAKGLREAIKYLIKMEDERAFRGLILHNVFFLAITSGVAIVSSLFVPVSIYVFIFLGSFLLHMIADIVGDFRILGHANNWLWVMPEGWLDGFGRSLKHLQVRSRASVYVLPAIWLVLASLILVTLRWGLQLGEPASYQGLYIEFKRASSIWLPNIGLILLVSFASWLLLMIGAVHKYRIELRRKVLFSLGSVSTLFKFLTGRILRTRSNAERVYLSIEGDQAVWGLATAILTTSVLLLITWWHSESELLFFLTPIFFALLFGTLVHSTVGELGSVFGVLLAWLLNTVLSRLGVQEFWPVHRGFLLLFAAVVAWTVGLLGAMFLRGTIRMSITAFVMEFSSKDTAREDGYVNVRTVMTIAEAGLNKGYAKAHEILLGNATNCKFLRNAPSKLLLDPYAGNPILGDDYYHLQAIDSYSPVLREIAYVLCDNRLTLRSGSGNGFRLLPIMPRYRTNRGALRDIKLVDPAVSLQANLATISSHYFTKTWAEFIDHFVTRRSTIKTDILVYPVAKESDSVTVCGLTRECTSTKEYATIEAEVYAGAIIDELKKMSEESGIQLKNCALARIIYPRVSIFDQAVVEISKTNAVLTSPDALVSTEKLNVLKETLEKLSSRRTLPYATADFGKRMTVLAFEIGLTTLIAALGFNPSLVQSLLANITRVLR